MSFGNHVNTNVSQIGHNRLVTLQPCQFTYQLNQSQHNTKLGYF